MVHWELCRITFDPDSYDPTKAEVVYFRTWERERYASMQAALLILRAEGWVIILYYTSASPPYKEVALLQRLSEER